MTDLEKPEGYDYTPRNIGDGLVVAVGDEMTWPGIGRAAEQLEYRLRYSPTQLSKGDLMMAASFVGAYRTLVMSATANRQSVVMALRKAAEAAR